MKQPRPCAEGLQLCSLSELHVGRPLLCDLGRDSQGRPIRALLLLGPCRQLHAYLDRCRHMPIPLDTSGRHLSDDGEHLVCRTHGARYRIADGYCVAGPCQGLSLWPLATEVVEGEVRLPASALARLLRLLD